MIKFRQREFTEYDAMRSLYVQLTRFGDRNNFQIINTSSLIPILKGNNIVIEKFVINSKMFGKDTYRMYLRVGAKAKMPDEVKLPLGRVYDKKLAQARLEFSGGLKTPDSFKTRQDTLNEEDLNWEKEVRKRTREMEWGQRRDSRTPNKSSKLRQTNNSDVRLKLFNNNNNNKNKNKNNNNNSQQNAPMPMKSSFGVHTDISYQVRESLGKTVLYDKKTRSLVLEFKTIEDAIKSLNILPFGLGYKIYLLDS